MNAGTFGARDTGPALALACVEAFALTGSLYATPVLALAGLVAHFIARPAGLRLLAAAVILSVPFTAPLLAERL